ncbi:haloacid dehalogenase [Mycobacterium sp. 852013-51886_SCH5428379]|uniref:cation-translocating P-type ATPase n=1 Tax=Mycobacterium sp. 852013-51886_SCH5428379 TaxID=1834111 RepID=UPI0007FD4FDE|nr:cation-translocating P-type ATPase [Mycobacterium sp. 852013-51886_SCH5428379]OBB59073.1 haloacid dehalogenase [Mycobacterium sp. 852013-51886_SCH5428379]
MFTPPGLGLLSAPLRAAESLTRTAAAVALEALGGAPARRCQAVGDRCWIEVRGLGGERSDAIATAVVRAVDELPGVRSTVLNSTVARIVVTVDREGPSLPDLLRVVDTAERSAHAAARRTPAMNLPGDDAVLVARTAGAVVAMAGLGVSVAGTVLRVRGLPSAVSVPATIVDHTPALRRMVADRLGPDGTDLIMATAHATTAALTISPASAVTEAAQRTMLAAEAWGDRLAWRRKEPELARYAADDRPPTRRVGPGEGRAERFANRAGTAGAGAAAALGLLSGNPNIAAEAAAVAAPKAVRTTREAFGCALGRGLTSRHGGVVLHPRALRTLDRVDTVVIDPRALHTDELMISRIRGLTNSHRSRAWQAARAALADGSLTAGWHSISDIPGAGDDTEGEVLVSHVRDPYAAAVVAEARRARPRVVTLAVDGLRSLAQGFDHLHDVGDSADDALAEAVAAAKDDGATVALITTADMTTPHAADVTVGVFEEGRPPPWSADVLVSDLTGVWRILHALPAARAASDKGVELSLSSSTLGALMLIPGVPGKGSVSVQAGAIAGLVSGAAAGRRVVSDPLPRSDPGHDWHALPADEVARVLPRPPDTKSEGAERNLIPPILWHAVGGSWGFVRDFVGEMRANLADPLTPILLTGAMASALLGSPFDAALVGSVLLGNAALSAEQQLHAERVLRRLLAVQDPLARRIIGDRAGEEELPANQLRPGDLIEVRSGEVVPADARLIEAVNLEVDESSLTGESLPVAKDTDPAPGAPLAERGCMLYAGSTAVAGAGVGIVVAVGAGSEMRRAMALAPLKSRDIGLQAQLRRITGRALPWSVGGGALVGALSLARRTPLRASVASAVGVIVAAVPEGLPLVATLAQLAAARRLSGESVLIRNPHSIEALARVQVVCFDKTGTLSENRLQVKALRPIEGHTEADVLAAAASTIVVKDGQRTNHATDDAILRATDRGDSPAPDAVLPFQSGRPFAAALTGTRLTIKGAPERIVAALADGAEELSALFDEMTADGLRVLAVAEREVDTATAEAAAHDPEKLERLCRSELRPVGAVGLADTLRPAAARLLTALGDKGIGVRLITGDHPVTASVVARDLGLNVTQEQVVTGDEWEIMSADERTTAVTERVVFARMTPEHKIDVVQALEAAGVVTAMVGDGANDAAAIRAASVGIGVASAGSDPARTAADVMLLGGHIEALLDAIDEGNQLWRRVQSAVSVLLGGNAGEVSFALITSLLTGRSVLNARQMLLVNMLTDALPAAALAVSPQTDNGDADRDESVMWRSIAIRGAATTTGATAAWLMASVTGRPRRAATAALIGLVSTQMLQTLIDSHGPLVVATNIGTFATMIGIVSTPGVSQLFGCTPVGPVAWGQAFLAAAGATAASAVAPTLLARATGIGSVLDDDDDARPHQNGVDLVDRRGEDPDRSTEQRVLTKAGK